jgi:hypothetical protein
MRQHPFPHFAGVAVLGALLLAPMFPAGPVAAAPKPAATPTAPPMKWTLSVGKDGSVDLQNWDGDDAGESFSCQRGKGVVRVNFFADPKSGLPKTDTPRAGTWKGKLTVRSGAAVATYPAKVDDDENNGGNNVWAQMPVTAPFLVAWGRTGRFTLSAYGDTSTDSPVPVAKAAKLLKLCAKK